MTMRISKFEPIAGAGLDKHGKLPGYVEAPVPPAPPTPLIPTQWWAVVVVMKGMGLALTGKWSMASVATEGMGDILWGYDWGPGQIHVPLTPPRVTPSLPILLLGSTTKYFLPSFAVKEKQDGALSGDDVPVAISFGSFGVVTQQCHDKATAISFVAPSSFCHQAVSTRWVGFNWADCAAGFIAMAGDALAAFVVGKFGGKLIPGNLDDQLLGGLASTFVGFGSNLVGLVGEKFVAGAGLFGVGLAAGHGLLGGLVLTGPFIGLLAGKGAEFVGEKWGDKDWGEGEPPEPEPAPVAAGEGAGGAAQDGTGGTGGMDAGTDAGDGDDEGLASYPDDEGGYTPADDEPLASYPDDEPLASYPDDEGGYTPADEPAASHPDDEGGYTPADEGPAVSEPDDEPLASYPDDDEGGYTPADQDTSVAPDEPNASYPDDEPPNTSGG